MTWSTQVINGLNCVLCTGTETSFANLKTAINNNSITTVTYESYNDYTIYNFGTTRLIIWNGGQLTFDPDIEMIYSEVVSTANDRVAVEIHGAGSRLNIGKEYQANGKIAYSRGTAIIHPGNAAFYGRMRSVVAHGGGEIHWYGGELKLGDGIGVDITNGAYRNPDDGAAFAANDPEWGQPGFLRTYSTNCIITSTDNNDTMQIKINTNDDTGVEYNGLVLRGAELPNGYVSATRFFSTNGMRVAQNIIYERAFIQPRTGATSTGLVLYNQTFENNIYTADLYFDSDQRWYSTSSLTQPVELHNIDVGSAIRMDSEPFTNDAYHSYKRGWGEVWQEIGFSVVDLATRSAISNVAVRIDATNHGDRREPLFGAVAQSSIPTLTYNNRTILSDWADRYQTTTNAAGETSNLDVLTYLKFVDTSSNVEIFYSKTTTNGDDLFDVVFSKYGYIKTINEYALHASSPMEVSLALIEDTAISQQNSAVVAAYTGISANPDAKILTISQDHTLDQIYDYYAYFSDQQVRNNGNVYFGISSISGKVNFNGYSIVLSGNITSGSNNTTILSNLDFDFNDTTVNSITLGNLLNGHQYKNLSTSITSTTFDTSRGDVRIELDQATEYMFDPLTQVINGGNLVINARVSGVSITTSIPENQIIQDPNGQSFTISQAYGQLRINDLIPDSRVVLWDNTNTLVETLTANAEGRVDFTTEFFLPNAGFYRVFAPGYIQTQGDFTISSTGFTEIAVQQVRSAGYTNTTKNLNTLNGTTIDPGGHISFSTINKEIIFEQSIDLRESVSIIAREWKDRTALYGTNISQPWNLDSVSGISFNDDWTLTSDVFAQNEGYVLIAANAAVTGLNYRIRTINNDDAVTVSVLRNSTINSTTVYPAGEINSLVSIDPTWGNASVKLSLKNPDELFIVKTETVIDNDLITARFYRNEDTNFTQTQDPRVTEVVTFDANIHTYSTGLTEQRVDSQNTTVTFDRKISVRAGTSTLNQLVNELSAAMAGIADFDSKEFSIVNNQVIMPDGFLVVFEDDSLLSGEIISFVRLFGTNGTPFVFQQTRLVVVQVDSAFVGNVKFAVQYAANVNYITDLNGETVGGIANASVTQTFAIPTTSNISLVASYTAEGYTARRTTGTLTESGFTFTITPTEETVALYRDTTLTQDSSANGTKAWNPVIDQLTFDWSLARMSPPNTLLSMEAAYFYRGWKRRVDVNPNLLWYGVAMRGVNSLADPDAANNEHLWNPGFYFNDNWAIDVAPNRPLSSVLEVSASLLERDDPQRRSGLVYVSPFSNGGAPVLKIISSQSTLFESETTQTLSTISSTLGEIVVLASSSNRIIKDELE